MDKKAFTLIELIIVVVIIAILAAIAVPMMQNMKAKAVATDAVLGLNALATAVQQYRAEYPGYPPPGGYWITSFQPKYFPGITFRSTGVSGTLDSTYFSQESYQYYVNSSGEPIVVLYVNAYGNYTRNVAPKAREAAATTDSPPDAGIYTKGGTSQYPCLYLNVATKVIKQWGWSKSGLPE